MSHYNVTFYFPVERKDGDKLPNGYWKEIGQAFTNDRGQITVKLYALPLSPWDGKLRLFPVGESPSFKPAAATKDATATAKDEWGDDFWAEK